MIRRVLPILAILLLAGCTPATPPDLQGYLEGEFVYVASPLGGRLATLAVARGARVDAGQPLFTLERASELAAQRQAAQDLAAARARLEDARKGLRPSELASLAARLDQARAADELARLELGRQKSLYDAQVVSASDYDRARLARQQSAQAVDQLTADLATAGLGGRPDQVAAAEAEVRAAEAAQERADWNVNEKAQAAPAAALVADTLYRPGEYVAPGNPVLMLLPPENLRVRFFVPEKALAPVRAGGTVRVRWDGAPQPLVARINYISPQPEYTPPVLYNRDNRAKLVFLVEASFTAPGATRDLHPGQPVNVRLDP